GKNGEDGTIQGLIQLAGIPIIGCDLLSSAIGIDKDKSHKIVKAAGIDVPKGLVIDKNIDKEDIYDLIGGLKYPLFVKPVDAGSSYGITKIYKEEKLLNAIDTALQYSQEAI